MPEEAGGRRFAVVIPAYSSATTLTETLAALAAQEELADGCIRVFLADDGSTDGTADLAERAWTGPVPLYLYRSVVNKGQWANVNAALPEVGTQAEWVFLLHADDLPKPHWYRTMRAAASLAAPSVASVCSSWDDFDGTEWVAHGEDHPDGPVVHVYGTVETARDTLLNGCWWHVSGCAIRSEAFAAIGPFAPDMPQLGDYDWLLRCLRSGHCVDYVPQTLLRYRRHALSVSAASFREHRDIVEWRRVVSLHGAALVTKQRLLYRQRIAWFLRRIARSALTRDGRCARKAAALIARLAVDFAVRA